MFEKIAYAADGSAAAGTTSPFAPFIPILLMFVILYFFIMRPQHKRQQELTKLVGGLKKGDRVITAGGLIGVVTSIQEDYVVLKVGDNEATKIEVLKSAISGLRN